MALENFSYLVLFVSQTCIFVFLRDDFFQHTWHMVFCFHFTGRLMFQLYVSFDL
jgi:hypothetical protein